MARTKNREYQQVLSPAYTFSRRWKMGGYIRLSKEDLKKALNGKDDSNSVKNQRDLLNDFYRKYQEEFESITEYVDDGHTGTDSDREAFQQLLADVMSRKIDCVVVKDLSRFARNYSDAGSLIDNLFVQMGVRFISLAENVDSYKDPDSVSSIIVPITNVMNDQYCYQTSKKIRQVFDYKRRNGQYIGSNPPFGYVKDAKDRHHLVIDPDAAEIVRLIFSLLLKGTSKRGISFYLNEHGIPSPSVYKLEKGMTVSNKPDGNTLWSGRMIHTILTNPMYTGDLVQGKTKIMDHRQVKAENDNLIIAQGTHEAIVSHEMFEAVQAYRKEICEESKAKPKKPYTPNIFKGKVFCAHCGRSLHRQRAERKKGPDIYWFHCLTKSRVDRDGCIGVAVQESELMVTVTSILEKELSVALGMSVPLLQLETKHQKEQDALKSRMLLKRQEIEKYRRLVRGLYENFVQGVLTSEEYFTMKADYEEKIKSVSSEITELENEVEQLMGRLEQYRAMEQDAQTLERNHALTAELIERLIDRIEITHDRDIHVAFRFQSEFATQEKEADLCEAM